MTDATRYAILNANYIKSRLEKHYDVLYTRENGRVAHEMIFDLREFKAKGVEEGDVAKRLMDYGFHAPTVSFPVAGHADGRADRERAEGRARSVLRRADRDPRRRSRRSSAARADAKDNVLKNAPHTAAAVTADDVDAPVLAREGGVSAAVGPRRNKFWPSVGRIDNPYGDRNLMCVCPPMETYA